MKQQYQPSESLLLGGLLAAAGGGLDAYTYLCRGGVFANAETGNIVLLGLRLSEGDLPGAVLYLLPILAYAAGVVAAEAVRARLKDSLLHWRQYVVAAEAALLCLVAFLPQSLNTAANATVAFVCAMQVQCFRKIRGNTLATTMCTGNLRSGTELLFRWRQTGDRQQLRRGLEYCAIILFFILGALGGGLLAGRLGDRTALVCAGRLAAAFLCMFRRSGQR